MEKEVLRKKYLKIRKKVENKEEKSYQIFNKVVKTKEFQKSRVVALYYNNSSEVRTSRIIEMGLELGKVICLPKVIDEHIMNFYQITSNEKLVLSSFNIYEPVGLEGKLIDKNNIDLIIVPGICFDQNRARIGYGNGYYDYYLSDSSIYKIGICYREQLLTDEVIKTDDNDIFMDQIITD